MRDELVLETPEQMRALAHPLRQRILNLVTDAPYTNKQLATILHVSPPRLHFHVRELLSAGMIEIVAEQPKGGVIEKYYRAVARVLRLSANARQVVSGEELMETTLDAVRQEFVHANTYFGEDMPVQFVHELVRFPKDRLDRVQEHLQAIRSEVYQAMEDPERDTYEHFVSITYLLHDLPPTRDDQLSSTGEDA